MSDYTTTLPNVNVYSGRNSPISKTSKSPIRNNSTSSHYDNTGYTPSVLSSKDFMSTAPRVQKKYSVFSDENSEENEEVMEISKINKNAQLEREIEAKINENILNKMEKKKNKSRKNSTYNFSSAKTFNNHDNRLSSNDTAFNFSLSVALEKGLTLSSKSLQEKSGNNTNETNIINSTVSTASSTVSLLNRRTSSQSKKLKKKLVDITIKPEDESENEVFSSRKEKKKESNHENNENANQKVEEEEIINSPIEDNRKDDNNERIEEEIIFENPSYDSITGSSEKSMRKKNVNKSNYYGKNSRNKLNLLYKKSRNDLSIYPTLDSLPSDKHTPRSLYLREVTRLNLLPLPLVLRQAISPYDVNLAHRGLGDTRVGPLIEIIDKLPQVHSINLCDNRLTDLTLMPFALKLPQFKSLTSLDLSFNKMDDSSESIMDYLRADDCTLTTLLLNGAGNI